MGRARWVSQREVGGRRDGARSGASGRGITARFVVAANLAILAILLSVLCVPGARAQMVASPEPAADVAVADPSPWSFRVAPFIWLPEIQGSISTRGATADVDIDIDKLFDLLGDGDLFAAGGHFEVGYD